MIYTLSQSAVWGLAFLLLCYSAIIAAARQKRLSRSVDLPTAGPLPTFTPAFLHNALFAINAAGILQEGCKKFKSRAFQIVRNSANTVVLPRSMLNELAALPATVTSSYRTIEHDLLGRYTGLSLMVDSRIHHSVLQRKLTPHLQTITPALEEELDTILKELLGEVTKSEWTVFGPYQLLITQTVVMLRLFPSWTHHAICYLLPSYWRCKYYIESSKRLLGPYIKQLLEKHEDGLWKPTDSSQDSNILHWLVETAKGKDRDPDTIAHIEMFMTMASIHTTLQSMVNAFYDLMAGDPDLIPQLLAEIDEVAHGSDGWISQPYEKLHKLDSVLRESQRASPPMILAMKRLFLRPHTFSNGFHAAPGAFVCMPACVVEDGSLHPLDTQAFDGLRTYRKFLEIKAASRNDDYPQELLFSSPSPEILSFGFGKSACPGRFFASRVLKILFVKLLTGYEFKPAQGDAGAPKLMAYEFLFRSPNKMVLVRRRS